MICGPQQMRPAIIEKLGALSGEHEIVFPALLLVARKLNEFSQEGDLESPDGKLPTAYIDFHPGYQLPVTPGSEAFLGSVIRDLAGSQPGGASEWLHPGSSLEQLADAKCRSIVLLSDYAGSGTQLARYTRALIRNPTLRSWHSGRLIKIYAVSFAATDLAIRKVRREIYIESFAVDILAPSFSSTAWSESERQTIQRICEQYAFSDRRSEALGYKSSMGLFATDSTVPNNLPVILRQTGPGWCPFFDERVMPPELLSTIVGYTSEISADRILEYARQPRLGRAIGLASRSREQKVLLEVLALASRRTVQVSYVAGFLNLGLKQAESVVRFLQSAALLSEDGKITALGLEELAVAKRKPRKLAAQLEPSADSYYPESLR